MTKFLRYRFLRGVAVAALAIGLVAGQAAAADALSAADFKPAIMLSIDGSAADVEVATQYANLLVKNGYNQAEVKSAVLTIVEGGARGGRLKNLIISAGLLAGIRSESMRATARQLTYAFGGSTDRIVDLDRKLNFMTADQYGKFRQLEKGGRFSTAADLALVALTERLMKTAE